MGVTIHLGARVARPSMTRFLPNLVMSKVCMAEPIAIMIFGGVFDRFPTLRFASIESGVGWMSWMAEYMDSIYHNQRHWLQLELAHEPSFYMDRNVWGSFIRDPVGIRNRDLPRRPATSCGPPTIPTRKPPGRNPAPCSTGSSPA